MNTYQDYTFPTLQRMWNEIKVLPNSVNLDTSDYQARIHKGIKVINYGSSIRVYSAETEFYKDITTWFCGGEEFDDSFKFCAHQYIKDKYLRSLNNVERRIKKEMNSSKNHKRFANLKSRRTNILNKYNEINTK